MLRNETRARARALQLLYACEATGRPVGDVLPGIARLVRSGPRVLDHAEALAAGVAAERERLDGHLRRATDRWRLERVAVVDRNILRLATWELLHAADVPPKVTIDEALWLAHRFGTPDSARFVNGVLDRVARDLGRL
jgi:transcription antitermination protein NusB